jgi:hypothetical protein
VKGREFDHLLHWRFPLWILLNKQPLWDDPEVRAMVLCKGHDVGTLLENIRLAASVKQIVLLNRTLMDPEDEVDPQLNMFADIVALKRTTMNYNEILGTFRPTGQDKVINLLAEVEAVRIHKEVALEEKLRNQFAAVVRLAGNRFPGGGNRHKKMFRMVVASFLQDYV